MANPDDKQRSISFDAIDSGDPIGSWLEWGDYLGREFGIDQFALVSWED